LFGWRPVTSQLHIVTKPNFYITFLAKNESKPERIWNLSLFNIEERKKEDKFVTKKNVSWLV